MRGRDERRREGRFSPWLNALRGLIVVVIAVLVVMLVLPRTLISSTDDSDCLRRPAGYCNGDEPLFDVHQRQPPDGVHHSGLPQPDFVLALQERCAQETQRLDPVGMFFKGQQRVPLRESFRVRAVIAPVSQFTSTSPLGGAKAALPPKQDEVDVSCFVEARLIFSSQDAVGDPLGWQRTTYLPPSGAEWNWTLTPQRAGAFEVVLELRPILLMPVDKEVSEVPGPAISYAIRVTVVSSAWDVIESLDRRIQVVSGLVLSVAALLALFGARRILSTLSKMRKAWGTQPEADDDTRPSGYL